MKQQRSGFTLIEIIVAIGLIGVIATGFLGVISTNYRFLFETKKLTETAFLAQKDMELGIDETKSLIASPDNGGLDLEEIQLFENVTVNYYVLENVYENKTYYTYVSNQRMPSIPKLNISDVKATLNYDVIATQHAYNLNNTNVKSSFTNDPATTGDLFVNVYSWYVSKDGFNIPVPNGTSSSFNYLLDMPETEFINRYPIYPNDFTLIATETGNILSNVSAYAGKHVLLAITPAAKSGKLGNTGFSVPVYINKLPTISNLILHLDASHIDPYDTTEVLSSTNRQVLKWNDLESNIGKASPTEFATSSVTKPVLHDTDVSYSFNSRFVRFESGKTVNLTNSGTSGHLVTYFALVRGNDYAREESIFVNGGYTSQLVEDPSKIIQNDGWYIVSGSYNSNSNAFVIGNDALDLIELLVYDGAVDSGAVENYFRTKYLPYDYNATIVSIDDFAGEVFVGEAYTLPSTAYAQMSYGQNRFVEVEWSVPSPINTTTTDIPTGIVVDGWAKDDPSITFNLTLTVKPVAVQSVGITPTTLNLLISNTAQLTATVLPNNATYKQLNWSTGNSNIATVSTNGLVTAIGPGTTTIRATSVENPTIFFDVPVTVQSPPPTEAEVTAMLNTEQVKAIYNTLTVNNPTNRNTPTKPTIITPADTTTIAFTFSAQTVNVSRLSLNPSKTVATITRDGSNTVTGTLTLRFTSKLYTNIYVENVYTINIPRDRQNPSAVTAVKQ